jgi:hypothetical protein
MGVPTSEVGYTSVTTGRGDHEVHKGHVVALGEGEEVLSTLSPVSSVNIEAAYVLITSIFLVFCIICFCIQKFRRWFSAATEIICI